MRIAVTDHSGIILIGVNDMPFGIGQQRQAFGPVMGPGRDGVIRRGLSLWPTGQFDMADRGGKHRNHP